MPGHPFQTVKPSLAYAKLVATPTDVSWAQAYNAGNLFVTVALEKPPDEEGHLQAFGKELFSHLESEFFTLEQKNLVTIKKALADSLETIPPYIEVDLTLAYVANDILYLFIYGEGKVVMKRKEKIGVLLEKKHAADQDILSASGLLYNNDCIVLQTKQFVGSISNEMLTKALELVLPNDIAETLSPQIHETDSGGEAAIIITYQGIRKYQDEDVLTNNADEPLHGEQGDEAHLPMPVNPHKFVRDGDKLHEAVLTSEEQDEDDDTKDSVQKRSLLSFLHFKRPRFRIPLFMHMSHTKKLFISIIVIIIGLLIVSIYYFKKNQQAEQTQMLFSQVYPPALSDYQNGKALEVLNLIKAHNDFLLTQNLLSTGESKFQPGSPQYSQIADLLQNVQTELTKTSNSNFIQAQKATVGATDILMVEKNNPHAIAFGQDSQFVYYITNSAVFSVNKATGQNQQIITNSKDWVSPQSVVAYEGNIYILDRKNGVLKYVAGSGGFGKSLYFKSQAPDLTSAVSMAIDGNVWILFQDGTMLEFTKGQADNFQLTGLDQSFSSPTKLFTDITSNSIYVLDRGNARIVIFDKTGKYEATYASAVIQQARDFEVLESENKILVLSNNTIWQIPLK